MFKLQHNVFLIFFLGAFLISFKGDERAFEYGSPTLEKTDSTMVRSIFDQALMHGEAYKNLENLCFKVGHRLSGTPEAEKAVDWAKGVLDLMKLDRTYKQAIEVPQWKRGKLAVASILGEKSIPLNILALGGSVSTNGPITAVVLEVNSLEDIKNMDPAMVKGKIVFYNRPMDARKISTFEAYGGCVDQRYWGAVEAAKAGAVAVLVRSMTTLENDPHPHTGSMGYEDTITKIPAAAISTSDANKLHNLLAVNKLVKVKMDMNPSMGADVPSFNVIGEIKGTVNPDKIILVGGHLDSWDVGHGAHDDGAGVVHSMEVLRILKALNYKPRHTIRVVLFMNEENGNRGGKGYAARAFESKEDHIAAIESDRGGFSPRGFSLQGDSNQLIFLRSFRSVLEPYGLHFFEMGYGGVDINPLGDLKYKVDENLMLMGLVPDSQRYFDYHHSADDIFENVNKRELELGCASMAALVYLLDKYL